MFSKTHIVSNCKKLFGKLLRSFVIETNEVLLFLLGLLAGLVLSNFIFSSGKNEILQRAQLLYWKASSLPQQWQSENNNSTMMVDFETTTTNDIQTRDDIPLADQLYNNTRVLCWVMTAPATHMRKAIHVKNTWGRRCNKLIFVSSAFDPVLGTINLSPNGEGREFMWVKVRAAFKYIYENHIDEADWFLKADDDSYVIMENLRAFLYSYSTEAPVYFGFKYRALVKQGYMAGGAGYVLSKEALRRFVEKALPNKKICREKNSSEDSTIGECLQNVGIAAGDTRDEEDRSRFHPFAPQQHLTLVKNKTKTNWYWEYIFYPVKEKMDCCSNFSISFHYVPPRMMYQLDFLIYKLKLFGISRQIDVLPPKYDMEPLVQKWRSEKSIFTV